VKLTKSYKTQNSLKIWDDETLGVRKTSCRGDCEKQLAQKD
jgi:hypothetical protein